MTWAGMKVRENLEDSSAPLRLIRTGSASERRTAAGHLRSETGDSEIAGAFAALIGALEDEDEEVRAMAAQSLAALVYQWQGRPASTESEREMMKTRLATATANLVPLLSDRAAGVRLAAAMGLGAMVRPSRRVPTLEELAALKAESNSVRRVAALAIWGSPDCSLPSELVLTLADESAEVRMAAARAIERFPISLDAIIPELISKIEHD